MDIYGYLWIFMGSATEGSSCSKARGSSRLCRCHLSGAAASLLILVDVEGGFNALILAG